MGGKILGRWYHRSNPVDTSTGVFCGFVMGGGGGGGVLVVS